jgi:heme exporter protein D
MLIVAVQSYVKHKSLLNTVMVEKARKARIKKAREEESKKA